MSRSHRDGRRGGAHRPQPGRDFPSCGCCDFPPDIREAARARWAAADVRGYRSEDEVTDLPRRTPAGRDAPEGFRSPASVQLAGVDFLGETDADGHWWVSRRGWSLLGQGPTLEDAVQDLRREALLLHATGAFDPARSTHPLTPEAAALGAFLSHLAESPDGP